MEKSDTFFVFYFSQPILISFSSGLNAGSPVTKPVLRSLGERVGQADVVAGLEIGGGVRQTPVGGVEFDGRGPQLVGNGHPGRPAVLAPDDVLRLGIVDYRHRLHPSLRSIAISRGN